MDELCSRQRIPGQRLMKWAERINYASRIIRLQGARMVLVALLCGDFVGARIAFASLISPEFALEQPVNTPSPSTRAAPAVAANPSGYLAVWTHGKGENTEAVVAAARVDAAGLVLDPFGFAVSPQAGEQTVCAVAANSNHFLVVWTAQQATATDWDILGARVLSDGTVLDSTPLTICNLSGSLQCTPAVAGNGANFLVVWRDSRGTAIYGALVAADGSVWPTNGFVIGDAANDQYAPAVASLGANYLVVWQDYRNATTDADVYGARVTGGGIVLDPGGIPICTRARSQFHPAVAADATCYLVVWEDYDAGGNDVIGLRVSPEGVVLDPDGLAVCHATNSQMNPVVTLSGNDFLVIWQDYRDCPTDAFSAAIYGTRVRNDGLVMEANGVPLSAGSGEQWSPAVAACSTGFLAVWQDFRNNQDTMLTEIFAVHGVNADTLTLDPELCLSGSANAQIHPALAAFDINFLAAWADTRAGTTTGMDIYGVRLDATGSVQDAPAIPICTVINHQLDPAGAANGSDYLVVWTDWRNTPVGARHGDIYGAWIGTWGVAHPTNGFPICTATNDQNRPAIAALGTNFIVAWQDGRASLPTSARWDIYAARVSSSGEVLDPFAIPVCVTAPAQTNVAVAANATQSLVVWSDFRFSRALPHIFGARVGADGSVLDADGLAICTAPYFQTSAAVAADGQGYFVVWCDWRGSLSGPPVLYGALVSSNGVVSPPDGFPIRATLGVCAAPAVAFNGRDYFVTWQESAPGLPDSFELLGLQVGPEGHTDIGPLLRISGNGLKQISPAVAAGSDGRFVVAHQAFESLMYRVSANFVNSEAVPRIDSSAWPPGGPFQFRFRGAVGERYVIEASTNLESWNQHWLFTNTQPASVWSDPDAANCSRRYYRAMLLP